MDKNNTTDPKEKKDQKGNEDAIVQPDPETLHTTDPQEHMSGPISSLMQQVKDTAEENNKEDEKDKDEDE